MSATALRPPPTLNSLPNEIVQLIALQLTDVFDFLTLAQISRSIHSTLWSTAYRRIWYEKNASATLQAFKAASALGIPLPSVTLSTFLHEIYPLTQKPKAINVQDMITWVWRDAMPHFIRVQIVTMGLHRGMGRSSPTSFGELLQWFGMFCTTPIRSHHSAPIQFLTYAWLAYRFSLMWAERFCRIAFKGALEQRRRLIELDSSNSDVGDLDVGDFIRFQRRVQSKIISTAAQVGDELIPDTVSIYYS